MEQAGSIYRRIKITGIKTEAASVKTFYFEPADGQTFMYKSGQFITLLDKNREQRRSYSLSSSSLTDEQPCFTVKRVPNGLFSRLLIDQAKAGDEFEILPATGFFTLPGNLQDYKQLVFFAAGIGITPILSIIKSVLHQYPSIQVDLIYSNRSKDETVFYDQLEELRARFAQFKTKYLFSNSADLMNARLSKLLLPVFFNSIVQSAAGETLFYLCGPFSYMRMVILGLEEQNIVSENIRKENFDTVLVPTTVLPPDTAAHLVSVSVGNTVSTFTSAYPDTILRAARKNHINLPYSCETGKCGTCAAVCTSGKVWMSYNEVLTEMELAKGIVLTCTGYPIENDVIISFAGQNS